VASHALESSGAHVEQSQLNGVELFVLTGEFDAYSSPALEQQLVDAITAGSYSLMLDMSAVAFVDVSTLNAIIRAMKLVYQHNGHLVVVTTSRPVLRAIDLAGLRHAIRVFPVREEGLAALGENAG
jgi:anti-sigma B factor antagonist